MFGRRKSNSDQLDPLSEKLNGRAVISTRAGYAVATKSRCKVCPGSIINRVVESRDRKGNFIGWAYLFPGDNGPQFACDTCGIAYFFEPTSPSKKRK